jgi:TorA maturation chaperone TorD
MGTPFEQALLRSAAYNALSLAFLFPEQDAGPLLAGKLRSLSAGALAFPWPAVAVAADAAAASLQGLSPQDVQDAFLAVFGHTVPVDCPPYEAEYNQPHLFQKSQTLADIAAYYAAFGVSPNAAFKDRQDHLSMETAFMDLLAFKEAYALSQGHGEDAVASCRKGQEGFLKAHLSAWARPFARRVQRKAGRDNPYLYFAGLLDAFMEVEAEAFHLSLADEKKMGRIRQGGARAAAAAAVPAGGGDNGNI